MVNLVLFYSTMVGLSANFIYNSAMTLTGMYFPNKHQAMATCLASAGVSFGKIVKFYLFLYLLLNVDRVQCFI